MRLIHASSYFRMIAAVCVFMSFLLLLFQLDDSFLGSFGRRDLIAFWAGASIFLKGGNPYSLRELETFYESLSFDPGYHQIFWNPPWCLTFFGWFGVLSFSTLVTVWLVLGVSAIAAAFLLVSSREPQVKGRDQNLSFLLQLIVLLSFYPLAFCLGMGQLSAVLLLVLTVSLLSIQYRPRSDFLQGALLSLLFLKPHLFHLVFLIAGWELFVQKRSAFILGVGAALLFQALFPLLWNSQLYSLYSESQFPTFWFNSSLGALAQSFSPDKAWLRFIPMIVIDSAVLLTWRHVRERVPLMYAFWFLIVPLSLLSAPYAWVYDFVLLIPALQLIISASFLKSTKNGIIMGVLLLFLNAALGLGPEEMAYYFWVPAAVAVLGLIAIYSSRGVKTAAQEA